MSIRPRWADTRREFRALAVLAGPIVAGQVGQTLMGLTDTAMIGQLGRTPLAAAAFASTVFHFVFIPLLGLLSPVAVVVARCRGAGDATGCAQTLRHGMALSLGFGSAATGLLLGALPLLHLFGQPPEVVSAIGPYYVLIAVSLLPATGFHALKQYYEGLGRPGAPMLILLCGVLANIVLNYALIYGRLGAPELGLTGAGIATLIARVLVLGALITHWRSAPAFDGSRPARWTARLEPGRTRELLRLGVPGGLQYMFEAGAFTAAALMMGWLGTASLAAHQIAISCVGFTFMFALGISFAAAVRVSHAVGAAEHRRLPAIAAATYLATVVVMAAFALVFLGSRDLIAGLFTTDAAVADLAARLLLIAAVFQLVDGAQVVGVGALRGLTDVVWPTILTCLAYWAVSIPVGWLLGFAAGLGPLGIWSGLAAGLAVAAITLAIRFSSGIRRALAG